MGLQEIEERVRQLDLSEGEELIYSLLRAYGLPNASVSRLKNGTYNRSKAPGETLWKGKVFDRVVDGGDGDLHALIDDAANDERVQRERPRFVIARNAAHLLAVDTETKDTLDIALAELGANAAFFMPWAGFEKRQLESLHYADVKAAERMARLYDEIVKENDISTTDDVNRLNVFFARLLFCFFAEDTGVFPKGSFTDTVASLTNPTGVDTASFLDALFTVLNTHEDRRTDISAHFLRFGHVNGSLFEVTAPSPRFNAKARSIVIDSGALVWSQINPDIFGSMMQAVVHPGDRQTFGMHYTSVENILKVIEPLFLDSLKSELASADTVPKLRRFIRRLSKVRVFDPACGSGNFLVIAYKELRRLEHKALQRIGEIDPSSASLFTFSEIKLESFYGIEIDGFASQVAKLALWIAKHQMNTEFKELFGADIPLIPLRDAGNVVQGNATRLDWDKVCPPSEGHEVYLLGNPPYAGARLQDKTQKADMQALKGFGNISSSLDYVAAWLLCGAQYVTRHGGACGFVATNSICQGDQVSLLWPHIYEMGADIAFGVQSFKWSNNARGNAGVTCIIVGLKPNGGYIRWLYKDGTRQSVSAISPYLTASPRRTIIAAARQPMNGLPEMVFGTRAVDGGHLIFNAAERAALVAQHPTASVYLRPFIGATEFLGGIERYILYLDDHDVAVAREIPEIDRRLNQVAAVRRKSPEMRTQALARSPHAYYATSYEAKQSVIVPRHSSERRLIVPMGFLDSQTVISDAANAIYGAEPWLFALLQSRLHTAWVATVGGKIKTDYRYSATLCYNTFPIAPFSDADKAQLAEHAFAVLEAREHHTEMTLGNMYQPEKMPAALQQVHEVLDETVDRLYGLVAPTDNDRLDVLFPMYEQMTAAEHTAA